MFCNASTFLGRVWLLTLKITTKPYEHELNAVLKAIFECDHHTSILPSIKRVKDVPTAKCQFEHAMQAAVPLSPTTCPTISMENTDDYPRRSG